MMHSETTGGELMIATTPSEFLDLYGDGSGFAARRPPTMRAALLVTPHGFRVSEESSRDNRYMSTGAEVDEDRARDQHRRLRDRLVELGVPVVLLPGREGLDDAVFPNNVYATAQRRLVLGAMRHPVRRAEARREDVRCLFQETFGYEVVDLSTRDLVAELTGPLVIDRPHAIGFCGMTGRVAERGCEAMHEALGLDLTLRFELAPEEYHTNLVLAVLAGRACVIHPPSFADPEVPRTISRVFANRTLVLDDDEKAAFAGNCLAVTENDVLFSSTATERLRPSSVAALESWGFRVHSADVDELEKGGGSLRCLVAEIF